MIRHIDQIIFRFMLTKTLKCSFSFNILNAFKGIKDAIRAPIKHIKAANEPAGNQYSIQTNTTEEAFDEVASEWQAHLGGNPFDLQTYNYLENAQLANFGTVDNPLVVFTADAPFRYVGCSGPQNEDDYESHELFWIMLREGPLQRCSVCGQVFKLVRLRNEFSPEMDYYMPNFNKLWFEDMGESDTPNLMSATKTNTHFEPTLFAQPENSVYSFIGMDDHDRILTDPAYRIQRQTEGELKARIYMMAMEDYRNHKIATSPYREPISKRTYENLMEADAIIRKLDRSFRQVAKFESRKYVDPVNHARREARMQERARLRWDNSYTIFSGTLTEEEQKYRDYFETDLQQNREDERLEEFLDRQEILADEIYSLRHYDFQEGYTVGPEDDQTSYIEKKIFKYKYRRALDTAENYERRNTRMVEAQKARFLDNNVQQLIENYIREPTTYEKEYLEFLQAEGVSQYNDYFESDKDELETEVLGHNKVLLGRVAENWQIPRQDSSSFQTFPLPEWNKELGFWPNAVELVKALSEVPESTKKIDSNATLEVLAQSSLVKRN